MRLAQKYKKQTQLMYLCGKTQRLSLKENAERNSFSGEHGFPQVMRSFIIASSLNSMGCDRGKKQNQHPYQHSECSCCSYCKEISMESYLSLQKTLISSVNLSTVLMCVCFCHWIIQRMPKLMTILSNLELMRLIYWYLFSGE